MRACTDAADSACCTILFCAKAAHGAQQVGFHGCWDTARRVVKANMTSWAAQQVRQRIEPTLSASVLMFTCRCTTLRPASWAW